MPSSEPTSGQQPDGREHIVAGIETSCRALRLDAPPWDCCLRLMRVQEFWIVYVAAPVGHGPAFRAWLSEHGPFEPVDLDLSHRDVTALETLELPQAWARMADLTLDRTQVLRADGSARLRLAGPRKLVRGTIERLAEDAEADLGGVRLLDDGPDGSDGLLTEEQRDALEAAYEAGYFDVPRKIRLSELADRLDKSQGALSELIRRATKRLIGYHLAETDPDGESPPPGRCGSSAGTPRGGCRRDWTTTLSPRGSSDRPAALRAPPSRPAA